jgi:hypothetical protein
MTISILLRLLPDELRSGRLVGRLRIVSTGEERRFKDAAELADIARAALAESAGSPHPAGTPDPLAWDGTGPDREPSGP